MSDGWTDGRGRSITNFLANSPSGTIFLKSIDTSSISHSCENMFELLDSLVEEIGEDHVVQVLTDSVSAYVLAGEKLMEKRKKLFWSSCAAHCTDLMLEDIGQLPMHANTLSKAKQITTFIYQHTLLINMIRKFANGYDLIWAGVTRFTTSYLTLSRMHELKKALRSLFVFEEWLNSPFAKKSDGKKMENLVVGDAKFWDAIVYYLKSVIPLVKVLRLVDGDFKPVMGYIFEAMDRAKEKIAKNFDDVSSRFHFDPIFNYQDEKVTVGLIQTIERTYSDVPTRLKIDRQLENFKKAEGMFLMDLAIVTRDKKHSGPRNLQMQTKKKGIKIEIQEEIQYVENDNDEEFDEYLNQREAGDSDVANLDIDDDF
ncbi:uncharacterized protein LOC120281171 [Dioscorea cayenensis subsp. rotundata]|uniref:Uncharacterized protein LOC120281171 n=1 Tax=Dioscorea cayennensis subsp. rotundata TaxID=55577 RepID=A0AB40CVK5_DIOCR|nr:uncharacterized protein LOC120281171 [Dioscorea cayenensis subsp. rotundata]